MNTTCKYFFILLVLLPATLWAQEAEQTERPCEINDSSFVYTRLIQHRITQVKTMLATSGTLQANRLYLQTDSLLEAYLHCLKNLNRKCLNNDALLTGAGLSPKIEQLIDQLKECNIEIRDIREGQSDMIYTPFFYYDLFKDYVSKDFRDFLKIKGRQNAGVFSADAAIVIPWEEIGQYVMDWESFIEKYPSSYFKGEAANEYFRYINSFLFGDYNSPVLDETSTIDKDIRPIFDNFLKKYPNSKSAQILTFYLEEVKNNEGKAINNLHKSVDEFIEQLIY